MGKAAASEQGGDELLPGTAGLLHCSACSPCKHLLGRHRYNLIKIGFNIL